VLVAIADWQIRRFDVNLLPTWKKVPMSMTATARNFVSFETETNSRSSIKLHTCGCNSFDGGSHFYQHRATTWLVLSGRRGQSVAGKSSRWDTLTQQLKNTFLDPRQSYWRKLRTLVGQEDREIERKAVILEFYANRITGEPDLWSRRGLQGYGEVCQEPSRVSSPLGRHHSSASVYSPYAK
jgi:hypothetical protein